ncbi:Hsp20/alpha crystallin family protein (plasmid) [Tundrisphaera lichenicola]|uniref:Hsp20/alpha crystallin family protein n=1 Tax=Tundrisphaera lichenicola TaxID=2029860 RepID=UPI003EB8E3C3
MSKSSANDKDGEGAGPGDLGGFLGGLGTLIGRLSELAEKGKDLQELKEFGAEGGPKGVYGFTIRTDINKGRGGDGGVKVEPFGNVAKDAKTGRATVREVTEPPVDVFEETGHVLVVAELPGISDEDIKLELRDDVLEILAERGPKKYRKEVLLPASFEAESMTSSCRNGVLEIKLAR